jgi:dUTP pyrophosphatase
MKIKMLFVEAKEPTRATSGSSGLDVYSIENVTLKPGDIYSFNLGFAAEVSKGREIQVRSRSGLASKGVMVAGGIGTVDSDYRGAIKVPLINLSKNDVQISKGDRIAQLVVAQVISDAAVVYDNLTFSDRGEGGFGSTGN